MTEDKLTPITADHLIGIFKDKNFISKVRRGEAARRKHYFTSFRVAQLLQEDGFGVTCMCQRDPFELNLVEAPIIDEEYDSNLSSPARIPFSESRHDFYNIIEAFGKPKGYPMLSASAVHEGDLYNLHFVRKIGMASGIMTYPITVSFRGNEEGIQLLLVQETGDEFGQTHETEMNKSFARLDISNRDISPEDIAGILDSLDHYRSDVLTLCSEGYENHFESKLSYFANRPVIYNTGFFREYMETGVPNMQFFLDKGQEPNNGHTNNH